MSRAFDASRFASPLRHETQVGLVEAAEVREDERQVGANDALLAIARLLVASDEHTLFGQTEFAIRKHALEVISQAYNLHLAEKKTATGAARSTVRSAGKRRRTTETASDMRKASGE